MVLTGGASQLPGMRDLAALILDKQVRGGRPVHLEGLAESTGGPAYAGAAGLISYALQAESAALGRRRPRKRATGGLLDRVSGLIKEYL